MVVQGIIALALALPTGMLFGVGYGTGVRIGYEQVYPLLFPAQQTTGRPDPALTAQNLKSINKIYDTIGGKEASQMGIAKGLSSAMSELDTNPDFQALMELEYGASGRTPSSLNPHNKSPVSTSLPEGFLSDTERASALKQLEINRQKTIQENKDFANKFNIDTRTGKVNVTPTPVPVKTETVSFENKVNLIVLRFNRLDETRQTVVAIKGNLALHKRTLAKWRASYNTKPGFRNSLYFQIRAYIGQLVFLYPKETWFRFANNKVPA